MNKIKEILKSWAIAQNPNEEQEKVAEARMQTCTGCENYSTKFGDTNPICTKCSCPLEKKIYSPLIGIQACPERKWSLCSEVLALCPASIHTLIPEIFFAKYDKNDYVYSGNCFEIYYGLSQLVKPSSFLEIGVRFGFSFLPLMMGSPHLEYAKGYDNEEYGNNAIATENIKTHYWGSAQFDIENVNTQTLEKLDRFYDLISIDGDHSYNGKLHDLALTIGHCTYVILDDYDYHSDVRRAVDAFVAEHRDKMEAAEYIPSFRGSFLIKYKK